MKGSGYSLWFGSCTIITKNYSHFLCWTKLFNFLNEIKIWTSVGKFFLNNIKKRVSCRKVLSENLKPFLVVYFVRFICLDLTNNKGTKILVYSKYFRQRWFLNKRLRCWLNQTNVSVKHRIYIALDKPRAVSACEEQPSHWLIFLYGQFRENMNGFQFFTQKQNKYYH